MTTKITKKYQITVDYDVPRFHPVKLWDESEVLYLSGDGYWVPACSSNYGKWVRGSDEEFLKQFIGRDLVPGDRLLVEITTI